MTRAECTTCGEMFTGDTGFDRHRVFACGHRNPRSHRNECWDSRRCLSPPEIEEIGFERKPPGVWGQPGPGRPIYGVASAQRRAEAV